MLPLIPSHFLGDRTSRGIFAPLRIHVSSTLLTLSTSLTHLSLTDTFSLFQPQHIHHNTAAMANSSPR